MAEILFIRHAATAWNLDKRLQGRADLPLSSGGRDSLAGLTCPPAFRQAQWFCSPLQRAQQTARLLGIAPCRPEPALIEMDWGEWEGERVADLRARLGETMRRNEARGLDLQPPGGESPRQVMTRLQHWLQSLDTRPQARYGAVCHKGVIRAALVLATGWNMRERCPVKIDWRLGQRFELQPGGRLALLETNLALESGG